MSAPKQDNNAMMPKEEASTNQEEKRESCWSNVAVKLTMGNRVRRIPVARLVAEDTCRITKLRDLALEYYREDENCIESGQVEFSYLDEEGERIYLSTDIELAEALKYSCCLEEGTMQFLRVTAHVTNPSLLQEEEDKKPPAKESDAAKEAPTSSPSEEDDSSTPPRHTNVNPAVATFLLKAEEVMQTIRKEVEEVSPPPCLRKLQRKFSKQEERNHNAQKHEPCDETFDPRFVHPRHQCDMCHVMPIRGFRWRAVRPKTPAEMKKSASRKEFVEINFDLCHVCYVGWREQQSDGSAHMRKIRLPEGVKFHPVQLEQDRREHLRRHHQRQQRQQAHPHVHLDLFLRQVATGSSRLAHRCIKTLHLDELRRQEQQERHINLIYCAEVNEGILKSLSQLSKKREDAKMTLALAASAANANANANVAYEHDETIVATAISSWSDPPTAECEVIPVPLQNVHAVTAVDEPSVMTGDDDDDDDHATEILPSVASSEDVVADAASAHVDLALSGVSGMTLSSSLTLKTKEETPLKEQDSELSSSSLYHSALEGSPSGHDEDVPVVEAQVPEARDLSKGSEVVSRPAEEENKIVLTTPSQAGSHSSEESKSVLTPPCPEEASHLAEKERKLDVADDKSVVEAEVVASTDEKVTQQDTSVEQEFVDADEDDKAISQEDDDISQEEMENVEIAEENVVPRLGDLTLEESVASEAWNNMDAGDISSDEEDAQLFDEDSSDSEEDEVVNVMEVTSDDEDVELVVDDSGEESEEEFILDEESADDWDLMDDEADELFAGATHSIGSSLYSQGSNK